MSHWPWLAKLVEAPLPQSPGGGDTLWWILSWLSLASLQSSSLSSSLEALLLQALGGRNTLWCHIFFNFIFIFSFPLSSLSSLSLSSSSLSSSSLSLSWEVLLPQSPGTLFGGFQHYGHSLLTIYEWWYPPMAKNIQKHKNLMQQLLNDQCPIISSYNY